MTRNIMTLDGRQTATPLGAKRISGDPMDPGFALFKASIAAEQTITVTVDGVVAKDVVTADEGEGFILSMIVSLAGDIMRHPTTKEPKLVRRSGVVRITVA